MPVIPGGPSDEYNDAISEFGELVDGLELKGQPAWKLAMAFSKGLIAAYQRGWREATDEAARTSGPGGGRDA